MFKAQSSRLKAQGSRLKVKGFRSADPSSLWRASPRHVTQISADYLFLYMYTVCVCPCGSVANF